MGKVVVTEFISLDGVVEDPGGAEDYGRGGWAFDFDRGQEGDKFKMDELVEAEAQLLGLEPRRRRKFVAAGENRIDANGEEHQGDADDGEDLPANALHDA